jgi:hypothetical protein
MTRIELATPFGVGAMLGLSAGVVMGIMAGVAGVVAGVCLGAAVGFVTGLAMHRADEHRSARTRELDAAIGIHGGSIGAGPITMPPPTDDLSTRAWVAEWLTPPPPVAG